VEASRRRGWWAVTLTHMPPADLKEPLPPVPLDRGILVAVAARKGGVGKTTLAYELAAAWGGVLVDFDWDAGGATGMWGAQPGTSILTALDGSGTPPRVKENHGRPALVPCHPDLADSGWRPEAVADALERWATSWNRPVIVDTHPGVGELAFGAMMSAHLVCVPAVLRERELDALESMLQEHGNYPIAVIPNLVPPIPPERQIRRLRAIAGQLPVSPVVSAYPWLGRRARRSAVVLTRPAQATASAVGELMAVATFLRDYVAGKT
jgi:chromosome partitioning protein